MTRRTTTTPLLAAAAALTLLATLPARLAAQTPVPEPRRSIVLDDPTDPTIPSLGSQWLFTYPTTAPAPLAGTPYITAIKVTLTPTSGTGTRIVTIPRGQVTRETANAARCPPAPGSTGTVPCLRADDVPFPIGEFTLTAVYVTGEGLDGGASAAIPFSGSYPRPVAPRVRAVP